MGPKPESKKDKKKDKEKTSSVNTIVKNLGLLKHGFKRLSLNPVLYPIVIFSFHPGGLKEAYFEILPR